MSLQNPQVITPDFFDAVAYETMGRDVTFSMLLSLRDQMKTLATRPDNFEEMWFGTVALAVACTEGENCPVNEACQMEMNSYYKTLARICPDSEEAREALKAAIIHHNNKIDIETWQIDIPALQK